MIEIIKKGLSDIKFKATCVKCFCEFLYQEEDLKNSYIDDVDYVPCPNCNYGAIHNVENSYNPKDSEMTVTMTDGIRLKVNPRQDLEVNADSGNTSTRS